MSASSIFTVSAGAVAAVCSKPSANPSQIQFTIGFSSKPNFSKSFRPRIQFQNRLLPLNFLLDSRCFSAALDGLEASGDDTDDFDDEQAGEDPEAVEDSIEEDEEEGEKEENVAKSSGENGRLYVGNLPYEITSAELTQIFGEAGSVVDVQVVYDRVTDRSRGFAFVTMGTTEEAKEAIRMFDGSQIGGRTVRVNIPEVPKGGERAVMVPKIRDSNKSFVESPHKIYAGNLGWRLTSQGLRDAFADQPGLLSAKVIYERETGRSRGFGFISFESAEDAQIALDALNGVEVEGRPLRLNMAADKARAASPEVTESGSTGNLDSSELVSSIST